MTQLVKGWDRVIEGSRFGSQCDKKKNTLTNKKKKNRSKVKFDVNDLTVFKKNPSTSKFNLHHLYNFMDLLIQ